ncbi:protein involved in gliding motility EpsA [Flavobacteriaceae bacterium MAR_2010_188]|nr:protein involved in gliding motility EpsA [Flavobacteriaceae bacterium MAR_2010_188]
MKGFYYGITIFGLILLSSCVPHKDIVLYQEKGTANDSLTLLVEEQKAYRVQIDDILSIRVKALDQDNVAIFNPMGETTSTNSSSGERAYYDGFIVDLHGQIRVPTLGYINVLGYTTEEIAKMLEDRLLEEQFKETANIFVTVRLAGLKYTTSGEIGNGKQVLFQERVNIMEAIANAGGISEYGDRSDVMIIRQYPMGQKIYHLDITDADIFNSPYYYIQPNDMIYVKPLKLKSLGFGTTGLQGLTTVMSLIGILTSVIVLVTR